jgi:hypothetical protein
VCLIDESLNAPAMIALASLGLTPDQVPDFPFPMDRNDTDTFHAAYTQYPYPANRPIKQAEIENHHPSSPHRDIYGGSGVSASPDSSSSIIANASSSSSTELYAQSGIQDDYVIATSFSHGQVDGTILSLAATQPQRQSTTTQKALRRRQQKQRKRVRDMERKREQRSDDDQYFAMICELLEIELSPKNTLVRRSEYLCIHLFHLRGIECFIVLGCVGELVEQRKLDDDLRRQLVTCESDFTAKLGQPSAATDTCSSLPLDEHSALDGSDTGATSHSWPWSNDEWDEEHN